VEEVAADYRVPARSDDGTVEGLEHKSLPIIAVQWHPEMMETRATDPVFAWLVEAATMFAASRNS
jgi:putative glutamine amidotransferase